MATIDQLDIHVYMEYARFTHSIESTQTAWRLDQASYIPPQTLIPDFHPRMTEMEILLGLIPTHHPWALFFEYRKFRRQRRSPFIRYRVAPTLGSLEKQDADFMKLSSIPCEDEEEEEEKRILSLCFAEIEKINGWISFIVGRLGEFLQG